MLQSYGLPRDETFEEQPDIYHRISLFHAVLYGLETGDNSWVRRGVETILKTFAGNDGPVAT